VTKNNNKPKTNRVGLQLAKWQVWREFDNLAEISFFYYMYTIYKYWHNCTKIKAVLCQRAEPLAL